MNPQNLAIIMAPCIIRAPDHISPLEVAQQIGQTTRAVELIIKNRIEVMRFKFRSFSELETEENKIARRLTHYRKSRRIGGPGRHHRRSRIMDDEVITVEGEHKVNDWQTTYARIFGKYAMEFPNFIDCPDFILDNIF